MNMVFVYIDSHSSSGFTTGLGVASVSGYLKKQGVKTSIVYVKSREDDAYLLDHIRRAGAGFVGFYSTSSGYPQALRLASLVRQYHPDCTLMFGGVHAICCPDLLSASPFDAFCVGYGEVPLLEFCHNPARRDMVGLAFKDTPGMPGIPYFPPADRFDEFLEFDYEGFLLALERFPAFKRSSYRLEIIFNRQCPFQCSFCSNHAIAERLGHRRFTPSPDVSIEVLKRAIRETGLREVEIHDDAMTLNRPWFLSFIERYIQEVGLPFQCNLRAGTFTDEDAALLKKAGIKFAWLGVESGNEWVRNHVMDKRISNEQLLHAFDILRRHQIFTMTQNIIGVPGETPDMFLDTVRMNAAHNPGHAMLSVFCPYPGTRLYDACFQKGLIQEDASDSAERTDIRVVSPAFPPERIRYYVDHFERMLAYEKHRGVAPILPSLRDETIDSQLSIFEEEKKWPVNLGDLDAVQPVSRRYGLDRGHAIDRRYIEDFLGTHHRDIREHCLEVLSDHYTHQFGGGAVTQADVLDIDVSNRHATVIADLRKLDCIGAQSYDCVILTQTVHLIDDVAACLREVHRILKPGGVLLATVPVLGRVDLAAGPDHDCWRMTPAGARHAFSNVFGQTQVEVSAYGNVKTGLGFWVGLAQEDLDESDLTFHDPDFPVLVGVRAVKGGEQSTMVARSSSPVRSASTPNCTVLLYHRVADLLNDPNRLAISPDLFARHLSFLSRRYEILSPAEFIHCLDRRAWPLQESLLITFDDGYQDNLETAAPLLQHDGIGALFFVSSGHIGTETPFWWDDLETIIFHGQGDLSLSGGLLGDDLRLSLNRETDRPQAYEQWAARLKQMDTARRQAALQILHEQSGVERAVSPHRRILSESEARALAALPGMEIGGHTLSHTVLARLPLHEQYREIKQDHDRLAAIVGQAPRAFSYPNGAPQDQDEFTYDLACAAGYRLGFVNDCRRFHGSVRSRMEVSRYCVQNWSLVELRGRLDALPARSSDVESADAPEALLLETAVTLVLESLVKEGVRQVALFGAGKHTVWLVALIERLQAMRIVVIVDRQAASGSEWLGYPLEPETDLDRIMIDAVIVSSDTHAAAMSEKAKALWPKRRIVNLYSGFPPGTYLKRPYRHILMDRNASGR